MDAFEKIAEKILSADKIHGKEWLKENFTSLMQELMDKGGDHSLINDDSGRWAVTSGGIQNIPEKNEDHLVTTFVVEMNLFADSPEKALIAWAEDCLEDCLLEKKRLEKKKRNRKRRKKEKKKTKPSK